MKTPIIILIIITTIVVYFAFPWALIYTGVKLSPNPPLPKITYGEFPFRLEYEINGERIVVKDNLICEYDGIETNEGVGKHWKWKEHLASGNEKILLVKVDDKKEVYYDVGHARYYMGGMKEGEGHQHNFPNASFYEKYEDGTSIVGTISEKELFEKYNIRLISWDYTPPITNNFIND